MGLFDHFRADKTSSVPEEKRKLKDFHPYDTGLPQQVLALALEWGGPGYPGAEGVFSGPVSGSAGRGAGPAEDPGYPGAGGERGGSLYHLAPLRHRGGPGGLQDSFGEGLWHHR